MAYSKAPMVDTYQTKQIPLMYEWENRKTSSFGDPPDPKQTVAQNIFFELIQNQSTGENYYNVIKRDGWEIAFPTPDLQPVLGLYYWSITGYTVVVTKNHIYQYNQSTGVLVTTAATLSFTSVNSQKYGVNFTEFLFEDGHVDLIISSGDVAGGLSTAGAWNPISDPDFPTSFFSYPVFLDGYLFFVDDKGNIINSDLNNPYSWTASNFIAVESYPDITQAIARVGNYIVALGTSSCEWFYDAANPTGTPLARVDGATQEIGYLQGLAATENAVYFVGRSSKGAASVYQIKGLKVTDMGSPPVRRWLGVTTVVRNRRGSILNMAGHRFYIINQVTDQTQAVQTYMLDLDNQMWSSLIFRQDAAGPYIFSSTTGFDNNLTNDYGATHTYFSEFGVNNVSVFRPELTQDNSIINFTCQFTTRPLDFGNYRLKFVSRLVFYTDQTPASSTMNISWSDDDMNTYTTPRTVNVANVYQPLYACGSFRKRSFKLTYTDQYPMRWRSVEVDYNQGQA